MSRQLQVASYKLQDKNPSENYSWNIGCDISRPYHYARFVGTTYMPSVFLDAQVPDSQAGSMRCDIQPVIPLWSSKKVLQI